MVYTGTITAGTGINKLGVPSEASKGGLGKKRAAKGPFQLRQQVAACQDRGPIAYGRGQPQRCSAAARLHTVFRGHACVCLSEANIFEVLG